MTTNITGWTVINAPNSPAPDEAAAGVHHIAYTYGGSWCAAVDDTRRLKASGDPSPPAASIITGRRPSMLPTRDPDGFCAWELQIRDKLLDGPRRTAYFTKRGLPPRIPDRRGLRSGRSDSSSTRPGRADGKRSASGVRRLSAGNDAAGTVRAETPRVLTAGNGHRKVSRPGTLPGHPCQSRLHLTRCSTATTEARAIATRSSPRCSMARRSTTTASVTCWRSALVPTTVATPSSAPGCVPA
jgi:hypothetical protein